jgi:L-cysteine/cystine lyase
VVTPSLPEADRLAAVREALPATSAGIYLNTGSVGPMPAETHRAMTELADWELRVGRAGPDDVEDLQQRLDEARAVLGAITRAAPGAFAITHSTTEGMNIAGWALDWRAGDRVVTTRFEHIGGVGPLYTLRDRLGIELVMADLGDGGDDQRTMAALDAAIVPGTKLVSVSHVAWTTGARLPIDRIVGLAHDRGALVAVDGAQAVGAIPVDLGALGADFYAIPAQKWLLGPEGIAALYVAPAVVDRARRTFAGHFSYDSYDLVGGATPRSDARRFETSGFHRPSVAGMARSLAWLSMYVGLDWVHLRGTTLARSAADRLAAIPGVEVVTPRERMATLVAFRIAGWSAQAAHEEVAKRSFAIIRTVPAIDALRASVGFFNTEDEIDRFAEAVGVVAAHTPDTLPRRRTLAILGDTG